MRPIDKIIGNDFQIPIKTDEPEYLGVDLSTARRDESISIVYLHPNVRRHGVTDDEIYKAAKHAALSHGFSDVCVLFMQKIPSKRR